MKEIRERDRRSTELSVVIKRFKNVRVAGNAKCHLLLATKPLSMRALSRTRAGSLPGLLINYIHIPVRSR